MAYKQEIGKKEQQYNAKPIQRMCSNCEHFKMDLVEVTPIWGFTSYQKEKNLRCEIGKFAVNKTANCLRHKFKETT